MIMETVKLAACLSEPPCYLSPLGPVVVCRPAGQQDDNESNRSTAPGLAGCVSK